MTASGTTLAGLEGRVLSGTVATFTAANTAEPASNFTASIDWGDGHTTSGIVRGSGGGSLYVTGQHAYAEALPSGYAVKVSIFDQGNLSATASSTAKIAEAMLDQSAE